MRHPPLLAAVATTLALAAAPAAASPRVLDGPLRLPRHRPAPAVSGGNLTQVGQIVVMEGDSEIVSDLGGGSYGIADMAAITGRFYACYPDEFDAITVFTTFPDMLQGGAAYALLLAGGFGGLGFPGGESPSTYGSPSGRLISLTNMNTIGQYGSMGDDDIWFHAVMGQEFAHTWLAFMQFDDPITSAPSNELLGRDAAHWSAIFASGGSVMDGLDLVDNGDGTFTNTGYALRYGPLDLYAMGVFAPEEVGTMFVVRNATYVIGGAQVDAVNDGWTGVFSTGTSIRGDKVEFTVDDVVAALGPRTPAWDAENEDFRMAFILVTKPGETVDDAADAVAKLETGRLAWEKKHREWTMNRSTMCTDVSAPCPLAFAEVGDITVSEASGADGDGILEPGEDLIAHVTFSNAGAEDATTATAALTSSNPAVEAPDPEALPVITAGSSLDHDFVFRIDGDACGEQIDLEVESTIGTRTWKAQTSFRPGIIDRPAEEFATDAGWLVDPRTTDTATAGAWEHGVPVATFFAGRTLQPDGGAGGAGDPAWFTGPFDAWDEGEVAGGATTLVSAAYDLSGYVEPVLRYRLWYVAYDRPSGSLATTDEPHLQVEVSLDSGVSWTVIDQVAGDPQRWELREVPFGQVGEPGPDARFRFTAFDEMPASGRLVEVGIDDVAVISLSPSCRGGGGGGCCSAAGDAPPAGSWLLAGLVGLALGRRRRRGRVLSSSR